MTAFHEKQLVLCISFDIEKAYDTTWRYGILKMLHDSDMRGELPMFIQNFLSQRDFKCKIGSCLSSTHSQEQGVPQGSVISCCLFSLAINNMLNVIPPNVKKSLYVDDLLIYSAGTYQVGIERRLQVAINRVQQWALNHGFKFSAAKTTSIIFHRRRRLVPPPQVFLADQPIHSRSCIKYLGMTYDEKLTWKAHINKLKQDCSKHLNLLKSLSHTDWGSDYTTMLRLYRSIIRSKLDYGCFAYVTARSNVLELLDPIHNAAICLCLGAFRSSPNSSLLAESGEPPLSYRRHQLLLQFFARTQQLPTSLTSAYLQQQLPQNDTHSLITGNQVKASLLSLKHPAGPSPTMLCVTALTILKSDIFLILCFAAFLTTMCPTCIPMNSTFLLMAQSWRTPLDALLSVDTVLNPQSCHNMPQITQRNCMVCCWQCNWLTALTTETSESSLIAGVYSPVSLIMTPHTLLSLKSNCRSLP